MSGADGERIDTQSTPATVVRAPLHLTGQGLKEQALAALTSITIECEIPLRGGAHRIPTGNAPAMVVVAGGTRHHVASTVTRSGAELRVTKLDAVVSPAVVIKNPVAAFQPSKSALGRLWDTIRDCLADLVFRAAREGVDGRLALDGDVKEIGPLGTSPLSAALRDVEMPELDVDLLAALRARTNHPAKPRASPSLLHDLFVALAAATEKGTFDIVVDTHPLSVEASLVPLHASWLPSDVRIHLGGTLSFGSAGDVTFTLDEVDSKAAKRVAARGRGELVANADGTTRLSGDFGVRLDLGGETVVLTPTDGVAIPLAIGGDGSTLDVAL